MVFLSWGAAGRRLLLTACGKRLCGRHFGASGAGLVSGCGIRWRRRCPGWAARRAGTRPAMTSSSRSTNTVSPSVIGFRASDAVVMAGLRDLVSHRGGRASAAAPMAGDCEWIGRRKLAGGHVISLGRNGSAIAPVKPPGSRHRHPGIGCGGDGGSAGPLALTAVAGRRPPHQLAGDFGVIVGIRWCCVPPSRAVLSGRCPGAAPTSARVACVDSGTTAFVRRLRGIRRWHGEGNGGADNVRAGSDVPTRRPCGVRPAAGCSRRAVGRGGRTGRVGGGPRTGRRPGGPRRVGGGRLPARTSQRLTRRPVSPGGAAVSASARFAAAAVAAAAVASVGVAGRS